MGTPALDVDGFFWFTDVVKYGGGNECRLYKLKTHSIEMYGKSYVGSSCNNDTIAD